jgi:hypothetical protein
MPNKSEVIETLREIMTDAQIEAIISFSRKALKKGWIYTEEFYMRDGAVIMIWKFGRDRHWLRIATYGTINFLPVTMTCL